MAGEELIVIPDPKLRVLGYALLAPEVTINLFIDSSVITLKRAYQVCQSYNPNTVYGRTVLVKRNYSRVLL